MKVVLRKLSKVNVLCKFDFMLTDDFTVINKPDHRTRFGLLSGCVLTRNTFWASTKSYQNISIFDLSKIIKAEQSKLPIKGQNLWQVRQVSQSEFEVDYFVVPAKAMAIIPKSCQLLLPVYDAEQERQEQPLTVEHQNYISGDRAYLDTINWLSLPGLLIQPAKQAKPQRLTVKQLLLSFTGVFLLGIGASSFYLSYKKEAMAELQLSNQVQVNQALGQRKDFQAQLDSLADFKTFLSENPNVIDKLSKLNIDSKSVFLERISVIPKGVQLIGVANGSATIVLSNIIKSEGVANASFSRPVSKTRDEKEKFTIEVDWE